MENTGRIQSTLTPAIRKIIFGGAVTEWHKEELRVISEIDLAHTLMLAEQGIISEEQAQSILKAILELRKSDFGAIVGRHPTRGLYLCYEDSLNESLDSLVAGRTHLGRSRNDLGATAHRMLLRVPYFKLVMSVIGLNRSIIQFCRRYHKLVMPIQTNWQPAFSSTYGHYLAGAAFALGRDVDRLLAAAPYLCRCPLGAAAGCGTNFPIDPESTARMLGFKETILNSLDAVASRDGVLEILSATMIACVTVSRLAQDFLLFLTPEFGFFDLPDNLVGSSSALPQKRNPFLLEHVQGMSTQVTGALNSAVLAMHSKPFTNLVCVNTEGTRSVWDGLMYATNAFRIFAAVFRAATPRTERMRSWATENHVVAITIVEEILKKGQMSFRDAHHRVGTLIRMASEQGVSRLDELEEDEVADSDIWAIIQSADLYGATKNNYGGGCGDIEQKKQFDALTQQNENQRKRTVNLWKYWRKSKKALICFAQQRTLFRTAGSRAEEYTMPTN